MLIGILDVAQDYRQLSVHEIYLKRDLKVRLLGMTAVAKLRAKQSARLTAIKASEASSKLFYMQANGRRRKNFIQSIRTEDTTHFLHQDKAEVIFQHYNSLFGPPLPRTATLNWQALQFQRHDLAHLEDPFTEEEVQAVISDIAADKAPGPDGYIGLFFKRSWQTVKGDIMAALDFFHQ